MKRTDELDKLHDMLLKANIEHDFIVEEPTSIINMGRKMIKLYDYDENGRYEVLSAICHYGSYGYESGMIEIMGLLTKKELNVDSVVGWLTSRNVFNRIKKYRKDLLK